MKNLLEQLRDYDKNWRVNIAADPIEAAIEIGLLEPEDAEDYQPLDFNNDNETWD